MSDRLITILGTPNPADADQARLVNELRGAGWEVEVMDPAYRGIPTAGFILVEGQALIRRLIESGAAESRRIVAMGIRRFDFTLLEELGLAAAIDDVQKQAWFMWPEKGGHSYVYGHRHVAAHANATDGNDKSPFASEHYTIMEFGGDSWPRDLARYLDELRAAEGAVSESPRG